MRLSDEEREEQQQMGNSRKLGLLSRLMEERKVEETDQDVQNSDCCSASMPNLALSNY